MILILSEAKNLTVVLERDALLSLSMTEREGCEDKMSRDLLRSIWNTVGIYRAKHPLIAGMWFVGGRLFRARRPTEEEAFLLSRKWEGQVVYDVGANVGVMTLFFARAVGFGGHVVAFEPHPYSFKRLTRNVRVNRLHNVTLVNVGVGNKAEILTIFQPSRHLSGATLNGERAARLNEGELIRYEVQVDTMDNLISTLNLPVPQLIKIDVEGFEEQVLRGGSQTISRRRPELFIEIHPLADGTPTTGAMVSLLAPMGYRFYHVETARWFQADEHLSVRGGHIYAVPDARGNTAQDFGCSHSNV